MSHHYYISPVEYDIAAKRGIDPTNLDRRIRQLNWSKERALNKELRKTKDRKYWAAIAKENGIPYSTFMTRVNGLHWDEERAATEEVHCIKEVGLRAHHRRKYPKEILDLAQSNGIKLVTFYKRAEKMDPYLAATMKVKSKSECGRISADKTNGKVFT